MQKLNECAKGKHPGLVIMAQQLAISAEVCFEFLKWEGFRGTSHIFL